MKALLWALSLAVPGCMETPDELVLARALRSADEPTGVWSAASPPGVEPSDSVAAVNLLVDPVRPGDVYAFIAHTGVFKSADAGRSWELLMSYGADTMTGFPWGVAIDPDPSRDADDPPRMYATDDFGMHGLLRSDDGGVTWQQLFAEPDALFDPLVENGGLPLLHGVSIDPTDSRHLVCTFFFPWATSAAGDAGLAESQDGGDHWVLHELPAGVGFGERMLFVDDQTWVVVTANASMSGTWRTTTAGRIGGVPSSDAWEHVADIVEMGPQGLSFFDEEHDAILVGGLHGVYETINGGASWSPTFLASPGLSALTGTNAYLYGGEPVSGLLLRAPRDDRAAWQSFADATAMTRGPEALAAAFDGVHWVVLSANGSAGIWRYLEP